jgi:PAS domain S-box-containing protein
MGQTQDHEGMLLVRTGFIFIIGHMAWLISRETLHQTEQKLELERLVKQVAKDQEALQSLNTALQLQNMLFKHAEQNAKLGSYYWNLSENEVRYSDNVFRLLGHEPGDFKPSVESYRRFIHPDDRDAFDQRGSEIIRTGTAGEPVIQRIVTKDGAIKYLKSTSRAVEEKEAVIVIGTLQDVTDDVALNEVLRKKNIELEEINKELRLCGQP